MATTRREFIVGGAALILPWAARAMAQGGLSNEELEELFEADAEPIPAGFKEPMKVSRWSNLPSRPQAKWPERSQSVDYRHISYVAPKPSLDSFQITSATLHELASRNSFSIQTTQEHVLFGLRGCSPVGNGPSNFVRSIQVVESIPDHIHTKCLLGVWRPGHDDLWITSGSTVPNIDYMYQMTKGGLPCNMLPTGLHRYRVGTHRPGSRFPQNGAFRQVDPVPVLRNRNNLCFELPPVDKYDTTIHLVVADNIHAGMLEHASQPPYFSSAGCQVIPGGYRRDDSRAAYGPWAVFRERAGLQSFLSNAQLSKGSRADDGRLFLYMLLTGAEARIVAQGKPRGVGPRIRFGSSGETVLRLRQRLGITSRARGVDQVTMIALLQWQMDQFGYSDGIIDNKTAAAILMKT